MRRREAPRARAGARRRAQGGESRDAQARWQDRPRQKWVHLVFLSARPESFKGLTEALSLRKIFRPLVKRGEMLGYPVLLLGSLRAGPRALWDYARGSRRAPQRGPAGVLAGLGLRAGCLKPACCNVWAAAGTSVGACTPCTDTGRAAALRADRGVRPRARARPLQDSPMTLNPQLYIQLYERKLARFQQFAVLYPEYCWAFVGDNGQARARASPPGAPAEGSPLPLRSGCQLARMRLEPGRSGLNQSVDARLCTIRSASA